MIVEFKKPAFRESSFNCPHCNVLAKMDWYLLSASTSFPNGTFKAIENNWACECTHCNEYSLWKLQVDAQAHNHIMIYPSIKYGEPAHVEMPDEVKVDFEEARVIYNNSPRGAAALLRLSLHKLLVHLGEDGENIHGNIVSLIDKGLLPRSILKILDVTRIVGNESVHPGRMVDADRDMVAGQLFKLINLVIERAIADPKLIDSLHSKTPETKWLL